MQTNKDADLSMTGAPMSEDVNRAQNLLRELGVEEYDPRVVDMLLDIAYQTATEMLLTARAVSSNCGKSAIDATDVRIASGFLGYNKVDSPSREQTTQIAANTNTTPLPQIKHSCGLKLPNDRFCLLQNNVQWRMDNPPPKMRLTQQGGGDAGSQIRPEQVSGILKRRAPTDDFD
ncbi:unnamed protein product, partial [Mesorhabditis belari]|uniref:Transcription initiation factor TFIID subunit 9 n=1 Tax=Mesorhabditis belari TaxID=2138241 RepID=A0AAF3EFG9_9BILA